MQATVYNVLFVCTHNSARSILAEGLLRGSANPGSQPTFAAHSAGSQPSGTVHPLALETLRRMHVPADGLRSKDWAEFGLAGAPPMDFVFTVCDSAAGETCPVWPGHPVTAHWGVPDPSAATGSSDDKARAFWDTAVVLKRRIDLMLALPVATLDRMAIQRAVQDIGKR